jgi:pentapeptide MXKDX repeat protein
MKNQILKSASKFFLAALVIASLSVSNFGSARPVQVKDKMSKMKQDKMGKKKMDKMEKSKMSKMKTDSTKKAKMEKSKMSKSKM